MYTFLSQALTNACFLVIEGARHRAVAAHDTVELGCSLLTVCKTFPHIGFLTCSRALRAIAAAMDCITKNKAVAAAKQFSYDSAALWRDYTATLQSISLHFLRGDAAEPAHAAVPALVKFGVGRLSADLATRTRSGQSNWLQQDTLDCVQQQLCDMCDILHDDIDTAGVGQQSSSALQRLCSVAETAAVMISWLASLPGTHRIDCMLCSCVHSFKEVLQLDLLTIQGRDAISRHLADAAVGLAVRINDLRHQDREADNSTFSCLSCALAFPGVSGILGSSTRSQVQELVGTGWLKSDGASCCYTSGERDEHTQPTHMKAGRSGQRVGQNGAEYGVGAEFRMHKSTAARPADALLFL
eukprot:jgi/Ulvmu1/11588/UM079_0032.1